VNDVERLAEALRKANAELEVDPNELADAVQHAHRRLLGRLLAVAALSAVGALLLLSGGLAASQAVKESRKSPSDKDQTNTNAGKSKHPSNDGKKDSGGDSGEDRGNSSNSDDHGKKKQQSHASIGSGEETKHKKEPPVASQTNLKVIDLTATGIEVANEGSAPSEPFVVVVRVEPSGGEIFEETIRFEALAAKKVVPQEFKKELTCEKSGLIVAEIDPDNLIKESEEEDNTESEKCEPTGDAGEKDKEKSQGEEESTTSSVTTSPSTQEP
jgi:CARDB